MRIFNGLKLILALLLIITNIFAGSTYAYSNTGLDISAKSAIAIECTTGKILYEKNKDLKLPMASTTKIMTAILAIENNNLNKEITIPDQAIGVPGSSIYLEKGERLKIIELLYGLMLASGNDAAVALAIATSGSVKEFVDLMNKKAKELGLNNTKFSSPHGLEQGEHWTSAHDLAVLTAYAMKNKVFKEIVATKEKEIRWTTRQYNRRLRNKNKMLSIYEGAEGVKTGYTKRAGRCLVTSALRDNFRVVCVVLNAPDMWNDTKKILDYAYNNYQLIIIEKSELGFVKINNSKTRWAKIGIIDENNIIVEKNKYPQLFIGIKENLSAPLKKMSKVGELRMVCQNTNFSFPIFLLEECKKKTIIDKIKEYLREFKQE